MAYRQFVPLTSLNFQINRAMTNGPEGCREDEIWEIAPNLIEFNGSAWYEQWNLLARRAESEGRFMHAASYHRMSEFFLQDREDRKRTCYEDFQSCFYRAVAGDEVEKVEVPYGRGSLPALILRAPRAKGVIVLHGGFDSFMEEFYLAAKKMPAQGYDVVIFEGPGQGRPLYRGLKVDHRWEKPVGAVLDGLGLKDVFLVGISLGGYLALRAAAFEPRVRGAVAFDVVWDALAGFAYKFHPDLHGLVVAKKEREVNNLIEGLRRSNDMVDWIVAHGMHITGGRTPFEYLDRFSRFTTREISPLITQDVLVLAGERDHFVPREFFSLQLQALSRARSVRGRLFRSGEGGEHHCQVGDLDLAWNEIIDWIESL